MMRAGEAPVDFEDSSYAWCRCPVAAGPLLSHAPAMPLAQQLRRLVSLIEAFVDGGLE